MQKTYVTQEDLLHDINGSIIHGNYTLNSVLPVGTQDLSVVCPAAL